MSGVLGKKAFVGEFLGKSEHLTVNIIMGVGIISITWMIKGI